MDSLLSLASPMQLLQGRETGIVSRRDYRTVHLLTFKDKTYVASV